MNDYEIGTMYRVIPQIIELTLYSVQRKTAMVMCALSFIAAHCEATQALIASCREHLE